MRSRLAVSIGSLWCLLALAAPCRVAAAQSIFLAIPGVDGESTDAQFSGAIEALTVTGGVSAQGGAKAAFSPVVVEMRRTTAASPVLEQAVASGQRFAQAVVSFRRSGGDNPTVFLTITLGDVGVAAFERAGDASEDAPAESVSLTYNQIKTDYQRQNPDGSPGPVVSACWNVSANAKCQ